MVAWIDSKLALRDSYMSSGLFQLRGVVQEQLQDLPVPSILLKCLSCEFLKLCTFVQALPMVLCYRLSQEFIHL